MSTSRPRQWSVSKVQEQLLHSELLSTDSRRKRYGYIVEEIVEVLKNWDNRFSGQKRWQSFLNKRALLHEIEESTVALQSLFEFLGINKVEENEEVCRNSEKQITVVDLCCGKGYFSMLLSYLAARIPALRARVKKIVALDKMTKQKVNWYHIEVANTEYLQYYENNIEQSDFLIHGNGFNGNSPLALIGIHLCKGLSPCCVGTFNRLGVEKAHFLCLAPCCLPRLNQKSVAVRQYETKFEIKNRLELEKLRILACSKKRNSCLYCREEGHYLRDCSKLPSDPIQKKETIIDILSKIPCFKCGGLGHKKGQCPVLRSASRPPRPLPIATEINLEPIRSSETPFDSYCKALLETIDVSREKREIKVVQMPGNGMNHDTKNWNSNRKCTWLISN
eukprot:GSMAST32.ASY1.ANO1.1114.1 assembled CDS